MEKHSKVVFLRGRHEWEVTYLVLEARKASFINPWVQIWIPSFSILATFKLCSKIWSSIFYVFSFEEGLKCKKEKKKLNIFKLDAWINKYTQRAGRDVFNRERSRATGWNKESKAVKTDLLSNLQRKRWHFLSGVFQNKSARQLFFCLFVFFARERLPNVLSALKNIHSKSLLSLILSAVYICCLKLLSLLLLLLVVVV